MKNTRNGNLGVTLIELIIITMLSGLIFALGIHPILSQLRLIQAERAEIALFDDANLAVLYIKTDAMKAERAVFPNFPNTDSITFSINAASLRESGIIDPTERTVYTVNYSASGNELQRLIKDDGGALFLTQIITRRLSTTTDPVFTIDPIADAAVVRNHLIRCELHFAADDLTTERVFDVMLRSRDARRPQ